MLMYQKKTFQHRIQGVNHSDIYIWVFTHSLKGRMLIVRPELYRKMPGQGQTTQLALAPQYNQTHQVSEGVHAHGALDLGL